MLARHGGAPGERRFDDAFSGRYAETAGGREGPRAKNDSQNLAKRSVSASIVQLNDSLLNNARPDEDQDLPEPATPSSVEGVAEPSDEDCALRAREGDRRSAQELVKRHHEAVSRLLWRFARTRADLDDLVQDTFLRMVRGLPEWTPRQPFKHWLLRIATNTGRDYFRRQKVRSRWIAEPDADSEESSFPEPLDPGADPSARAAANEVKLLLSQLPPNERTLLTLYYLEGWKLSQVAEHLGWTLVATKLRAWRARARLRSLLEAKELL